MNSSTHSLNKKTFMLVLLSLTVFLVFAMASTSVGTASAAMYKQCGNVNYYGYGRSESDGYPPYARAKRVRAQKTSCKTARRVARYYISHIEGNANSVRPYGFKCGRSGSGTICKKGSRVARWSY
jgi:hypothetical protein